MPQHNAASNKPGSSGSGERRIEQYRLVTEASQDLMGRVKRRNHGKAARDQARAPVGKAAQELPRHGPQESAGRQPALRRSLTSVTGRNGVRRRKPERKPRDTRRDGREASPGDTGAGEPQAAPVGDHSLGEKKTKRQQRGAGGSPADARSGKSAVPQDGKAARADRQAGRNRTPGGSHERTAHDGALVQ